MKAGVHMKIAVCEDNRDDRNVLCSHIKKYFESNICDIELVTYENGVSFLSNWEAAKDIKIAFLDIYMPGLNGIELAKKIRESDSDMAIIITSTSVEHGLDGYAVKAMQYLVKPAGYTKVEDALNSCMVKFADSLHFIEVMSNRLAVKILLKDILYVEMLKQDCLIHTSAETIKCRLTSDEILRQLDGYPFLKTHRSYIVNMQHVADVKDNDFLLTNDALVPIRQNNKLPVKQAYMDYFFELQRGKVK
jgi:DNA-binding LytR/AlgR family response regulator